jgi:ribosomal protein S18 acetylase RimI-like enzyme
MALSHRPFRDSSDVERMKRMLEYARATAPYSTYLHVGDLDWRLYGPHGYPLSEIVQIWEEDAEIAGFVLLSAAGFDYQVATDHRGQRVEREMVAWGQAETLRWRRDQGLDARCEVEAFADDIHRVALLEELGYRRSGVASVLFARSLDDGIAEPRLPAGWEVRGLQDRDIDSRATAQAAAFAPGSKTTPATWRHLATNASGYDPELDSVAIAPDGTVAAAAVAWLDSANKTGEFEPVATRPAHQRKGCGRAVLRRGLRLMRERGMDTAIVYTNATNVAAIALYRSVGFEIRNRFEVYELTAQNARQVRSHEAT